MAYTRTNFPTKKALHEAYKEYVACCMRGHRAHATTSLANAPIHDADSCPRRIALWQPGPFGPDVRDGFVALEGPHYPEPHKWYASAKAKGGYIELGSLR